MQTGFLSTPVNQRKTFWKMEAPVWDLGTRLLPLPAPAGALNCPPATDCPQRPGSDLKTANSLVSVTFFMLLLGLNAGVEVSALTPQREGSNPGGVLSVLVLSRHSGLLQRSKTRLFRSMSVPLGVHVSVWPYNRDLFRVNPTYAQEQWVRLQQPQKTMFIWLLTFPLK